jgi:hypothetical protein
MNNQDLRAKAIEWINNNPIVRWTYNFNYDTEFKISNNHRAYIARWLVEQDPSLEKYLKLKKTNY